jgi:hypothetical protein
VLLTPKPFWRNPQENEMLKSKCVIAASLVFAASAAFADPGDLNINDWTSFSQSTTREQVKQEMRDAVARGERNDGERGLEPANMASPRSRDAVVAELHEATRLGLVSIGEGDVPIASGEQEQRIAKAGATGQFARSSATSEG